MLYSLSPPFLSQTTTLLLLLLLQNMLLLLQNMLASTKLKSLPRKLKKARKPRKSTKAKSMLLLPLKLLPQLLLQLLLDTERFESNSWKGPAGNGGPFLFVLIPPHR